MSKTSKDKSKYSYYFINRFLSVHYEKEYKKWMELCAITNPKTKKIRKLKNENPNTRKIRKFKIFMNHPNQPK